MKRKSTALLKLEKSRKSIITDDLDHCIMCPSASDDINEIFLGRNRQNSMKYGLCIPVCRTCHNKFHNDINIQLYWKKIGLEYFLKEHTIEEFKNEFKYIKGLDLF